MSTLNDTETASSITEALERAVALHAEVLRQVEELLSDEDVIALDDSTQDPSSATPF